MLCRRCAPTIGRNLLLPSSGSKNLFQLPICYPKPKIQAIRTRITHLHVYICIYIKHFILVRNLGSLPVRSWIEVSENSMLRTAFGLRNYENLENNVMKVSVVGPLHKISLL